MTAARTPDQAAATRAAAASQAIAYAAEEAARLIASRGATHPAAREYLDDLIKRLRADADEYRRDADDERNRAAALAWSRRVDEAIPPSAPRRPGLHTITGRVV